MTKLLHKVLPVTVAVILGLFAAAPSFNQNTTKPSIGEYPSMPSSIMDAELTRTDGTTFRLRGLKGKVVLLNLWAVWAGPSRTQIPELITLQKKYDASRFEVVGVNIGDADGKPETLGEIKKFKEYLRIDYELVRPAENAWTKAIYRLTTKEVVPQTLLIGIDGSLRGVFVGGGASVNASLRETLETVVKGSEARAILKGSVIDSFGAVIPNVTITGEAKDGTKFYCQTNQDGEYTVAAPSGVYAISFRKPPFDTAVIPKYQLGGHARMTLDISLTCERCTIVH